MGETRTVDAQAFREWMAPTIAVLRNFTAVADEVSARHNGLPSTSSRGMSEISAEAGYLKRRAWLKPIEDTHAFGGMALRAVSDNVRTFAEAFDAQRPPVYGHLVVARSALEGSVVTAWLSEPGISPLDRIKRGLCERLYSASEVKKLQLDSSAADLIAELTADAASFGWDTKFVYGKPVVDGTGRPSVADGLSRLLVDRPQAQIGRFLWNRLSAVTHVTWWGLQWALMLPTGDPDGAGLVTVGIGTDSARVATQAFCILRALRVAASERFTLMGWNDDQWRTACGQAEAHELALFRSSRQDVE